MAVSLPLEKSAAVVYATRFGTTETVAKALEQGLKEAGLRTFCASTAGVQPQSLRDYDLICLGCPTEVFSATKEMKQFIKAMEGANLGGKFAFAFDTKYDSRMSGSAAKYIEHALDDQGLHLVVGRGSAIVTSTKDRGKITGALLKDGEERRFEEMGLRLGKTTLDEMRRMPPQPP